LARSKPELQISQNPPDLLQFMQFGEQGVQVSCGVGVEPNPVTQPPCLHFAGPSAAQPACPQFGSQATHVLVAASSEKLVLHVRSHFPGPLTVHGLMQFKSHTSLQVLLAASRVYPTLQAMSHFAGPLAAHVLMQFLSQGWHVMLEICNA
jgi:hypothetical protein